MESGNYRRPSVPGESSVPGQFGSRKRQRSDGAKKLRVKTSCQGSLLTSPSLELTMDRANWILKRVERS